MVAKSRWLRLSGASAGNDTEDDSRMSRYRVTITSKDRQAMLDLVRKHRIKLLHHGAQSAGYVAHAVAEEAQIHRLQGAGYAVDLHEDIEHFDFGGRGVPGPDSLFRMN